MSKNWNESKKSEGAQQVKELSAFEMEWSSCGSWSMMSCLIVVKMVLVGLSTCCRTNREVGKSRCFLLRIY